MGVSTSGRSFRNGTSFSCGGGSFRSGWWFSASAGISRSGWEFKKYSGGFRSGGSFGKRWELQKELGVSISGRSFRNGVEFQLSPFSMSLPILSLPHVRFPSPLSLPPSLPPSYEHHFLPSSRPSFLHHMSFRKWWEFKLARACCRNSHHHRC